MPKHLSFLALLALGAGGTDSSAGSPDARLFELDPPAPEASWEW